MGKHSQRICHACQTLQGLEVKMVDLKVEKRKLDTREDDDSDMDCKGDYRVGSGSEPKYIY